MGNNARKCISLLLNDEQSSSVSNSLENSPYDVSCFTTLQQCGTTISKQLCDFLIITAGDENDERFKFLKNCRKKYPFLPIMMLVKNGDIATAIRAVKAGADQVLEEPLEEHKIIKAIDFVLKLRGGNSDDAIKEKKLTDIEKTVFELILKGCSSKQIAEKLNRSVRTIEDYRSNIMRKIGVDSLVELAKYATQQLR